jgi:uncharacterized protein
MKKALLLLFGLLLGLFAQAQNEGNYHKTLKAFRKHYIAEFKSNPKSPLGKKDLKNLRFYAINPTYAVECVFRLTPDEKPFDLPTYSGITKPYVKYGVAEFTLNGQKWQLSVYRSLGPALPQYRDYLFLPFKDHSNGEETYGGGRYINLKIGDIINNRLTIDFNKAYNPYCAYSDGYNCPIPPNENHLELSIAAGEKMYVGKTNAH